MQCPNYMYLFFVQGPTVFPMIGFVMSLTLYPFMRHLYTAWCILSATSSDVLSQVILVSQK